MLEFEEHAKLPSEGCFHCPYRKMCMITKILEYIHEEYNILGIDLLKSTEKWCTFLQHFREVRKMVKERDGRK